MSGFGWQNVAVIIQQDATEYGFIIILKPCDLHLLYAYVPTKLHLNLLY